MLRKALFAAKKRPVKSAIVTPIAEFSKAIRHRRSVRRRAGYFMTSIWSPLSEIKRGIRGFEEKVATIRPGLQHQSSRRLQCRHRGSNVQAARDPFGVSREHWCMCWASFLEIIDSTRTADINESITRIPSFAT